jgi:hypothetical protein
VRPALDNTFLLDEVESLRPAAEHVGVTLFLRFAGFAAAFLALLTVFFAAGLAADLLVDLRRIFIYLILIVY